MKKFILSLAERPKLNALIVLLYYLLVVLPHEQVGKFCAWLLDDRFGRDTYNLIILVVSIAGLGLYLAVIFLNGRQQPKLRWLLAFYLVATVALAAACLKLLIVINIEVIHFVQYAVMAILLFPLVRRYGETAWWVMLLGALDEGWQYFYLAPQRTNYYDFNDVIINLIGGGFGLILIRSLQLDLKPARSAGFLRSPVFISASVLVLLFFTLFQTGWLKMGPPAAGENSVWVLIRVPQVGFWTTVHPNVTFHVVQPLEGLIILGVLLIFYAAIGRQVSIFQK